jgi:SAM-dependent methyltransferase
MTQDIFDLEIYRKYNTDLYEFEDEYLINHFQNNQNEARIYGVTKTTSEFISMRWLRGSGIEFGAGAYPIKLYGNAKAIEVDSDPELLFWGEKVEKFLSIDISDFSNLENHYDFSIASHVLEHADSFLKAIENLILITKAGGLIYLVLPDIRFLQDLKWMPNYNFQHHEDEYFNPLMYLYEHNLDVIKSQHIKVYQPEIRHAEIPNSFLEGLRNEEISPQYRFLCHKHNYDFEQWTSLIFQTQKYFNNRFSVEDIRYGHERQDCHYVLKVNK